MLKTINEGKDAGSHLMALAAPLQFLDGYIKLAERMNLDIQGIDFGGNSQFQVLKAIGTGKVIMCVAVTENHTCITIAKGDRLILQRMLPWGGDDFNRIVGGISRSMDFFNSSRWSSPLDDIILAGTCANTAGLREAVSNALSGADVFTLEEYLTEFPNPGLLGSPALITQYITAFGSAFAPVDLIPEKYKATKERKKSTEHGIFGAVVIFVTCVAAGIIMSVSAVLENNRLKNELEEIEREITAAAAAQSEHRNYIVYRNAERGFVELEEAVLNRNSGLVKFFEELEEKMPSDILLMSAVCSNESVIMNLRVPSLEAAAMTITQFGTFESIQALEISALTQGLDEAGFPFYSFTINCLYDKPVVPERQTARDSDGDTDESGEE
jgi:type IV pilus assembly protein PilM